MVRRGRPPTDLKKDILDELSEDKKRLIHELQTNDAVVREEDDFAPPDAVVGLLEVAGGDGRVAEERLGLRDIQRRHLILVFAVDAQRGSAGDQQF